jgi:hypothetical protein
MPGYALLVALASFAWLALLTEWTLAQEGRFYAAERR